MGPMYIETLDTLLCSAFDLKAAQTNVFRSLILEHMLYQWLVVSRYLVRWHVVYCFYSECNLKATLMKVQFKEFELGHNAVEATKIFAVRKVKA